VESLPEASPPVFHEVLLRASAWVSINVTAIKFIARHRRIAPNSNVTRKTAMKMKNRILAIPAAPAAIPPQPNIG
jgi:hypothetical protein